MTTSFQWNCKNGNSFKCEIIIHFVFQDGGFKSVLAWVPIKNQRWQPLVSFSIRGYQKSQMITAMRAESYIIRTYRKWKIISQIQENRLHLKGTWIIVGFPFLCLTMKPVNSLNPFQLSCATSDKIFSLHYTVDSHCLELGWLEFPVESNFYRSPELRCV